MQNQKMLSLSFVADVKGNVSNFTIWHIFLHHLVDKLRRCQHGQVATKNTDQNLFSVVNYCHETIKNKINR